MNHTSRTLLAQPKQALSLPAQVSLAVVPPMITVEHLVKRYKSMEINMVDDISFTVAPGAFFALLGPNGVGKTTTLSLLTAMLRPTSGTVLLAGSDILKQPRAVRETIGMLFHQSSLDLNLTAEENMRFHTTLYGLYPFRPSYHLMPRAYREQIETLSMMLGIRENLFRPVKTYSGEMKRKLETVRSLLQRPRILFLDEPTAGLDPSSRRDLWDYLRLVRKEHGTTMFLTTHYLEEAEQADSLCIMKNGQVVARGTPAQIKAEPFREYVLLDAADHAALRAKLTHLKFPFAETPPFKLPLDAGVLHATLKVLETPLTSVTLCSLSDTGRLLSGTTSNLSAYCACFASAQSSDNDWHVRPFS